ncbi:hypothetical protein KC345_g1042 [Hortaea werneckii]|nr:hypothetical protein KC345_g1042 [Hortaea werneckii]
MAIINDAQNSSPGSFVTPEPLAPLLNGLKRAFDSSDHTDVTIICEGRQWKAHKVVLCAQSEWFKKSCAECWKEGKEGTIALKEDDRKVIDAMLHWFYEFDYGPSQDEEFKLRLDVRVYAAADKYLLPNLKRLAATKFEERAEKAWPSKDFVGATFEVYRSSLEGDNVLKQKIVRIVADRRSKIFHPEQGYKAFKMMAVSIPEFGRDVLIASSVMEHGDEWAKYKCPKCATYWCMQKKTEFFWCPKGCNPARARTWWAQFKED